MVAALPLPGGPRRTSGGGGGLFAFDLKTKQRTVITPEPIGGIDGIEPDGRGGYLVTDVFGSRILQVSSSGATRTSFSSQRPVQTLAT